MTSPVELPLYGKFKKTELSKEELIALWKSLLQRPDFNVRTGEKVEDIQKGADGVFSIASSKGQHRAQAVILCLGRSGNPRRLGVKGEELPKVMYRLIETDHYINKRILVVGGGDSAVEAAMGLANQKGNNVTLSYRREGFARIKERNAQRVQEYMRSGKVESLVQFIAFGISERYGLAASQWQHPGDSQRLCLDLRRRRAAPRFPGENRSPAGQSRHDPRGQ